MMTTQKEINIKKEKRKITRGDIVLIQYKSESYTQTKLYIYCPKEECGSYWFINLEDGRYLEFDGTHDTFEGDKHDNYTVLRIINKVEIREV